VHELTEAKRTRPRDRQGKTWSAQGNILVGPQVPEAMGKAFESTPGELAEKLFATLKAGMHMNVAFVDYLAGDKQAALDEVIKTRTLDPAGFNKSFKEESDFAPFKPIPGG
jgi:uncharacterized Ntn-hydrolase superfamily protein